MPRVRLILWAVSEKMGSLTQNLDNPEFPQVTYRRNAAGSPVPVLRGTGLRVQTVAIAAERWGLSPAQIADEYGISEAHVREALDFYQVHRQEIDAHTAAEQALEAKHG